MKTITIIGLGAGGYEQLPLGALQTIRQAGALYTRTLDHPAIAQLQAEGIRFTSFDAAYERHESFEPVYEDIVRSLLAAEEDELLYAVPGHPLVAERTVQLLIAREREGVVRLAFAGGQSFLDPLFTAVRIDPIEGFLLLDGTALGQKDIQMDKHLLIGQVYDAFSASDVKLTLLELYCAEHRVALVTAAGSPEETVRWMPLCEIDRSASLSNLTTLYVPPVRDRSGRLKEWSTARELVAILRAPGGCPWDRAQTHESLKPYALEEVGELVQAIDERDDAHMVEELGDVLLQVFLHAQIGEEEGYFSMEDILESLASKLIRRHPHVFGDARAESVEDVRAIWQEAKRKEREESE